MPIEDKSQSVTGSNKIPTYLTDREARWMMDNWRFFHILGRTHSGAFQYVPAVNTKDP